MMLRPEATLDAIEWHSQIATQFDADYERLPPFKERRVIWAELINRHLPEGGTVLDAGCGPGNLTELAAARAARVVAFDASEAMAKLARERLSIRGFTVEVRTARIERADAFGKEQFDLVMCSSVLEYVDDYWTAIEAMSRALRTGGVLLFSVPNMDSMYRSIERLTFRLIGKPSYLAYVRNALSLSSIEVGLRARRLNVIETRFYSSAPIVGGLLRSVGAKRSSDTMTALACRKA